MPDKASTRAFKTAWYGKAAKKDRANIDADERAAFKKLAQAYCRMTEAEMACALDQGDLQELFHDE